MLKVKGQFFVINLALIIVISGLIIINQTHNKRDSKTIKLNAKPLPNYKVGTLFKNSSMGLGEKNYILDYKLADVTGDHYKDAVLVTGTHEKDANDIYADPIYVLIQDGQKGKFTKFIPTYNSGYFPYIDLVDLNNDKVLDIFYGETVAMSGGAGVSLYNVFTFKNNKIDLIFGKNKISEGLNFNVTFLNNYKVKIASLDINKTLIIDVKKKKKEYESHGTYKKGILMEDNNGGVDPYSSIEIIDMDKDGVSELQGHQYLSGVGRADGLGEIISTIKYNVKKKDWTIVDIAFKEYK